ncbi:MAG: hypothetical protein K0Q63_1788 [Paenibacillus sp.]|nr:hypothetical protein [Paenibacillus sp.]
MAKLTPEGVRAALAGMHNESGIDTSDLLAYIEELESKAAKLEEELRKSRIGSARKTSSDASMNSRLKDALRE